MKTFTNPKALLLLIPPTIGVIYSFYSILAGKLYLEELNWVDVTTVLFLSLLTYRGIYAFRKAPPLKILALCLLNAFSFIYCFEGIYKLLFLGWLYSSAELRELLQIASNEGLDQVRICGLMGMASFSSDTDLLVKEFRYLRHLFDTCRELVPAGSQFQHLSMGMSSDFRLAIAEGSNMVRIGSLLFGDREKK